MNLRQQISKFRSEILIGKYDSALSLGKLIIARLQLFQQLGLIKSEILKHNIQEEYEKCLALNNRIHYKQVLKEEESVKKWGSKNKPQEEGKWRKKEDSKKEETAMPITPPKASKFAQQTKVQSSPIDKLSTQEMTKFIQLLQREILMPIKMPSFYKEKNSHFRVVTLRREHYKQIINYFLGNDFVKTQLSFIRNQLMDSAEKNLFAQASLQEIIVDCGKASLQEIMQLKKQPKLRQYHLVFLICSQETQLELF